MGTRTVHLTARTTGNALVHLHPRPDRPLRLHGGSAGLSRQAVTENNSRSASCSKIIRDRVRVLLVVGRPSWDERFLRGLLRAGPQRRPWSSFYILGPPPMAPRPGIRSGALADSLPDGRDLRHQAPHLRRGGVPELRLRRPALSIASYERSLEAYVQGAARLVVIGGDHAFGEGGPSIRCSTRALPVDPAGAGPGRAVPGEGHRRPGSVARSPGCRERSGRRRPGTSTASSRRHGTWWGEARRHRAPRAPTAPRRRPAGPLLAALGVRPGTGAGADRPTTAGPGPSPPGEPAGRPVTTTASGATPSAGWCAIPASTSAASTG